MSIADLLQHVSKYPVVSDSIGAFKSNPYGQKSIDLTNATYAKFVKPTFPYLEKPASYAKPYVAKADEIGDGLLSRFEERIPIVKSETADIKNTIIDYVHWPVKVANEQKDYLLNTYNSEYKKCGGDGVVAGGKALVSGSFVITSDVFQYVASLLQKGKQQAAEKADEAGQVVKEKTNN